jgi:hypothetical protein
MHDWHFGRTDGGMEFGINEAGLETFKTDTRRSLIRECLQNSVDAAATAGAQKPVEVTIQREAYAASDLPGLTSLKKRYQECKDEWDDVDCDAAFTAANDVASKKLIECLRVSDFETTGVDGADNDKKKGWFNLVRSMGSSNKGGQTSSTALTTDGGGSFGIGKRAALAASQLRVIYYSTRTTSGAVSFAGTSTLVTHHHDRESRQPWGFIGGKNGASITNEKDIPKSFRRRRPGLDVLIPGFDFATLRGMPWEDHLIMEVVSNLWPAIMWGKLICTVGKINIDAKSLPRLLDGFRHVDGFNAHEYYKAYVEGEATTEGLKLLRDCTVRLLPGEHNLKHVVCIRKNGMVIHERVCRSYLHFAGIFECRNDVGNRILRSMEPPQHNAWEPNRPSAGANVKADAEYQKMITRAVTALNKLGAGEEAEVTGLGSLLPYDDGHLAAGSAGVSGGSTKGKGAKVLPQQPRKPRQFKRDRTEPLLRRNSERGGGTPTHPVPVTARLIPAGPPGQYKLKVHPKVNGSRAVVEICVSCDDQVLPARILKVSDSKGKKLRVQKACPSKFGPVSLHSSTSFDVTLADTRRVALEVYAHEA